MRRIHSTIAILAIVTGAATGAPASQASNDTYTPYGSASALIEAPEGQFAISEDFWTDERIISAQPDGELSDALVGAAQDRSAPATATSDEAVAATSMIASATGPDVPFANVTNSGLVHPATVGKIVSRAPDGDKHECSGAVVTSGNRNLVYTAAHCIYNKGNAEKGPDGWHTDIVFMPAYNERVAGTKRVPEYPFGKWELKAAAVMAGWYDDHNRAFDQAFFSVLPDEHGRELVDVVGGNGLAIEPPAVRSDVMVWGYPIGYEPHRVSKCSTTVYPSNELIPNALTMNCDSLEEGASGGPWIKMKLGENRGTILGVTSIKIDGKVAIHTSPTTENTRLMYEHREQTDAQ